MKNTISVIFWARLSRSSKSVVNLQLRVTVNGSRKEIGGVGMKLKKADWDSRNQKVRGSNPLALQLNQRLSMIKADVWAIFNHYELKKQCLTAEKLKSLYLGETKRCLTFEELFNEYKKGHPKLTTLTLKGYQRRYKKIYLVEKEILPEVVNKKTLNNLKHILTSKGYSESYCYKCQAAVKMLIDYGVENDLIETTALVGYGLSFKREYDTDHLTIEELQALTKVRPISKYYRQVLDTYLLSCYTGMAYADLMRLDEHEISDGYIRGHRQKTKTEFFIPILPEAKAILKRDDLPFFQNSTLNKIIKEILPMAGIDRPMVFHSGRKTFANYAINHLLYSKEATAKMMGQKDIKELDAYANTSINRVVNERKRLHL